MATLATFPLLKTQELVPALQEIGCQVTADDIDRPNANRAITLYAWFLTQLTQLTLEDVMVAAQLQLDALENEVRRHARCPPRFVDFARTARFVPGNGPHRSPLVHPVSATRLCRRSAQ
jgi:hypothetical protein